MAIVIIPERPPVWDACAARFGGGNLANAIFAWSPDRIYNPGGRPLDLHLVVHEGTHHRQMAEHAAAVLDGLAQVNEVPSDFPEPDTWAADDWPAWLWWATFLADPGAMLRWELEAYKAQYQSLCAVTKNREVRSRYATALAAALSSPMYGSPVTRMDAYRLIRGASPAPHPWRMPAEKVAAAAAKRARLAQ